MQNVRASSSNLVLVLLMTSILCDEGSGGARALHSRLLHVSDYSGGNPWGTLRWWHVIAVVCVESPCSASLLGHSAPTCLRLLFFISLFVERGLARALRPVPSFRGLEGEHSQPPAKSRLRRAGSVWSPSVLLDNTKLSVVPGTLGYIWIDLLRGVPYDATLYAVYCTLKDLA